jgi:aspartyl aminopeptidase
VFISHRIMMVVKSFALAVLVASLLPVAAEGLASSLPPLAKTKEHLPLAQQAMKYFDSSSDPFHAVQSSIDLLEQAGFKELADGESYKGKLEPGGLYYFTRNKSTLVAFSVGRQYQSGNGFKIIGGHTDSPNLRVKPRSKRSAAGCIQIGVECYGGGLWHTWFDRDLGVSGRVLVRSGDKIQQHLVKIDRALLRISNLAIHLQTPKEREAFAYNKEDHLSPILALEAKKALSSGRESEEEEEKKEKSDNNKTKDGWTEYQEPALLQILAAELNVETTDIVDFELSLFDIQKANLGGAFSEFIHSARLDNLASCYLAVQALMDHVVEGKVDTDGDISMIVLYDHEEVGSGSAVGAASPIMGEAVRRISAALHSSTNDPDVYDACIRKSFVLSVDQAHAVHPNYAAKHEKAHQPKMNQGMVIKRNSNQRYATNVVTGVIVREIARRAGLPPVQEFMVRQDCGCGSTIGPVISQETGIRTIDLGCPQLSMHSIRETMGVCDLTNGLALFKAFFQLFTEVDSSIEQ